MPREAHGGGLVLVVGPSGAGKDTLIALAREALAGRPGYVFPRRLVTRPPSPHEDNDPVSEAEFAAGEAAGGFTLSWRAHGLGYALPACLAQDLDRGEVAVCNVSRGVVAVARARFPRVAVVAVTAPPAVLAARLARRARPEDGDLGARLARAVDVEADLVIENVGPPEHGGHALAAFLRDWR